MQIPLKRKYRFAPRGTYKGGERPAPRKNRNKINDAAKRLLPPQPARTLVVNGRTGKGVMKDAA